MTKPEKARALTAIAKQIANCKICKKGKVGLSVPGEGNPNADVVFIGEAPGKTEAETGRPFVGRSGKLLRGLLQTISIKDKDIFITSPVKYLPKYVTPKPADIEHGRLHLFKQLAVINPKIIVLLGNTATLAVLQKKFPIAQDHGKIIKQAGKTHFLSYHPAAALYAPKLRSVIRTDFLKLKRLLNR